MTRCNDGAVYQYVVDYPTDKSVAGGYDDLANATAIAAEMLSVRKELLRMLWLTALYEPSRIKKLFQSLQPNLEGLPDAVSQCGRVGWP